MCFTKIISSTVIESRWHQQLPKLWKHQLHPQHQAPYTLMLRLLGSWADVPSSALVRFTVFGSG